MTAIVKGVGMILMLCLHCYNTAYYYYGTPSDWRFSLGDLGLGFNLCVGLFAFMVGFGYSFSRTKDLRYALTHIKKLLIPYWIVLFVFTLPFCVEEVRDKGISCLLLDLIGLKGHYNYFNWFIYFYIYLMVLLPFVARAMKSRPVINALLICLASYAIEVVTHIFLFDYMSDWAVKVVYNCLRYTPVAILGLLFAQQGYFNRIKIEKWPAWAVAACSVVLFVLVLLLAGKITLVMGFQLDFVYIPLLIGAVVALFSRCELGLMRRLLKKVGEVSVYMWFLQALFFTAVVSWFYQPMITLFDNINLVVLWTMLLTFVSSWLLKTGVETVTKFFQRKSKAITNQ